MFTYLIIYLPPLTQIDPEKELLSYGPLENRPLNLLLRRKHSISHSFYDVAMTITTELLFILFLLGLHIGDYSVKLGPGRPSLSTHGHMANTAKYRTQRHTRGSCSFNYMTSPATQPLGFDTVLMTFSVNK